MIKLIQFVNVVIKEFILMKITVYKKKYELLFNDFINAVIVTCNHNVIILIEINNENIIKLKK